MIETWKLTIFEEKNFIFKIKNKSRPRTTRETCYFMYKQLREEKNPDPELENADPHQNEPDPQDWSETTVFSCAWVKETFNLHNISG